MTGSSTTAKHPASAPRPMVTPTLIDMLDTLIGSPSVSSTSSAFDQSNLGVIHALAGWLESLGFATEVMPLPDASGKANLIATLGSGPGGLVLAGHTDTVPFDEACWRSDPFRMTEKDNRLYGLGSCDMKGFFPVAIEAARAFAGERLREPLTIVATSDEESSMAGARYLTACGRPRARAAVIGEPTSLVPVFAHKGICFLSIRLTGSSGHSSNPDLGRSALDAMHAIMGELIDFRAELRARHANDAFAVAFPTLNLGCLHAGDNPNRICEQAELEIDLRILPGMDSAATLDALESRLGKAARAHGTPIVMRPFYPPVPPFETPRDAELVTTLEKLSGHGASTVAFGTEGPFMQALGMETVIFGPGSIDQAHQPNEYLDTRQIPPAVTALRELIAHYCMS